MDSGPACLSFNLFLCSSFLQYTMRGVEDKGNKISEINKEWDEVKIRKGWPENGDRLVIMFPI